ncbi:response regulator [Malonomonas rubra]|uniref:response regulator n=1 Tax=Malonomonas rubra TaxID=57040 RepID=UPI0026F1A394|nr:response regulator [Malonomonas rubra]
MKIAPPKVLLIDSEMLIHLAVSQTYRNTGPYFITAASVGEALKKMEIFNFDLFLLALDMNDEESVQLLKIIAQRFPDIPVILMSDSKTKYSALLEKVEASRKRGSWQLIEKPFNLDILKILVERSLYEHERKKPEAIDAMGSGSEKRTSLRNSYVEAVQLLVDASDWGIVGEKRVNATVTDLSDGGLGLITKYPLKESQPVRFADASFGKAGLVAWAAPMDNHICRAGIRFH